MIKRDKLIELKQGKDKIRHIPTGSVSLFRHRVLRKKGNFIGVFIHDDRPLKWGTAYWKAKDCEVVEK